VNYNVKKVFTKPIRIDALFKTMSDILGVEMDMDKTPSIVEVHVNDNILFVEIAQGLNREKLELLRYKIAELIALYEIKTSKVLVMLSDMALGFADGPNIKHLLDTVIGASKAKLRNIKIITRDTFLRDYVAGQKDYSDIEVVTNLQYALEGLLSELDPRMEFGEKKAEIIGNRILSSTGDNRQETVHLRFDAETKKTSDLAEIRESGKGLRIAAVDDDFVIQELIKMTFTEVGATVTTFDDGADFLEVAGKEDFDLVFLDLLMPKVSGFEVLAELKQKDIDLPIIVLSAVTKRDAVVKSFQSGVKSYLVKPLKPDAILKKAIEILKPNF
jgi:CheY-like chemotaxis protein